MNEPGLGRRLYYATVAWLVGWAALGVAFFWRR